MIRRVLWPALGLALWANSARAETPLLPVADIQQKTDVGTVEALGMFLTQTEDKGVRVNFAAAIDWQSPDPLWLMSIDGAGNTIGSWSDTKLAPRGFTSDGDAGFVVYGEVPTTSSARGPKKTVLRRYLKNGKRVWSRTIVAAPPDEETAPTETTKAVAHLRDADLDIVVTTTVAASGETCLVAYKVADGAVYDAFGEGGRSCLPAPPAAQYTTDRVVVERVQPVPVGTGHLLVTYANHFRVTWNAAPPAPDAKNNKSYVTSITHNLWVGVSTSDGEWQGSLVLPFNSNLYTRGINGAGSDAPYEVRSAIQRYQKVEHFRAGIRGDELVLLGSHNVTGRRFFYNVEIPFDQLSAPSFIAPDDEEVDNVPVREVLVPADIELEHIVQARPDDYLAFGTKSGQPIVLRLDAETLNVEGEPEALKMTLENFAHRKTIAVKTLDDRAYILSSAGGSRLAIFSLGLEAMFGPKQSYAPERNPYQAQESAPKTQAGQYKDK